MPASGEPVLPLEPLLPLEPVVLEVPVEPLEPLVPVVVVLPLLPELLELLPPEHAASASAPARTRSRFIGDSPNLWVKVLTADTVGRRTLRGKSGFGNAEVARGAACDLLWT